MKSRKTQPLIGVAIALCSGSTSCSLFPAPPGEASVALTDWLSQNVGSYHLAGAGSPVNLIIETNGTVDLYAHSCDSFSSVSGRLTPEEDEIVLGIEDVHLWLIPSDGVVDCLDAQTVVAKSEDGLRSTTRCESGSPEREFVSEWERGLACALFDGCNCLGIYVCDCNDNQMPLDGVDYCSERPCN